MEPKIFLRLPTEEVGYVFENGEKIFMKDVFGNFFVVGLEFSNKEYEKVYHLEIFENGERIFGWFGHIEQRMRKILEKVKENVSKEELMMFVDNIR